MATTYSSNFYIDDGTGEKDIFNVANIVSISKYANVDFDCKFFNHISNNKLDAVTDAFNLTITKPTKSDIIEQRLMVLRVPDKVPADMKSNTIFGPNLKDIAKGKLLTSKYLYDQDKCSILTKPVGEGQVLPLDTIRSSFSKGEKTYTLSDIIKKWDSSAFNLLMCGGGGAGGERLDLGWAGVWGGGGGGSAAAGIVFIWVKKAASNRKLRLYAGYPGAGEDWRDNGHTWWNYDKFSGEPSLITYSIDDKEIFTIKFNGGEGGHTGADGSGGGSGGNVQYGSGNSWTTVAYADNKPTENIFYDDDFIYIKLISCVNGVSGGATKKYGSGTSGTLSYWDYLGSDFPFDCGGGYANGGKTRGGGGGASIFSAGGQSYDGAPAPDYGAGGGGGGGYWNRYKCISGGAGIIKIIY